MASAVVQVTQSQRPLRRCWGWKVPRASRGAELKAERLTILLIEHKLEMVMRLSDRVKAPAKRCATTSGSARSLKNDTRVRDAYLGGAEAA